MLTFTNRRFIAVGRGELYDLDNRTRKELGMSSSHEKARSDCGSLHEGLLAPGVASYDRVR